MPKSKLQHVFSFKTTVLLRNVWKKNGAILAFISGLWDLGRSEKHSVWNSDRMT